MPLKTFSDPSVAGYSQPGHPEAPGRVTASAERLTAAGMKPILPCVHASEADVLTIHTPKHWKSIQTGTFSDPDTPFFPGIHAIALTSLSGALSALESALEGMPAFSLMRPPGHHAAPERISGFCYLNNVAIACEKARSMGRRVAVLDIDVHHGDGTEEIARGREGWFFVSLHQSPLYPGTGQTSNDNCVNFPLPPHTREARYMEVLEKGLQMIVDFKPDVLAVSAGFDTYKDCPLAQLGLEKESYFKIGRLIAQTKIPRFATLEGGYASDLPFLIENFLKGFSG